MFVSFFVLIPPLWGLCERFFLTLQCTYITISGTKRPASAMGQIRSGEAVFASAGALKLMRLSSEESQPIANVDPAKLVREVNNAYDPYQPQKV